LPGGSRKIKDIFGSYSKECIINLRKHHFSHCFKNALLLHQSDSFHIQLRGFNRLELGGGGVSGRYKTAGAAFHSGCITELAHQGTSKSSPMGNQPGSAGKPKPSWEEMMAESPSPTVEPGKSTLLIGNSLESSSLPGPWVTHFG
jgi:hypothetical protein